MNSRCTFWNKILPAFIPEPVDENDDPQLVEAQACTKQDIPDHSGDNEIEMNGGIDVKTDNEISIIDELPLYSFIDIE